MIRVRAAVPDEPAPAKARRAGVPDGPAGGVGGTGPTGHCSGTPPHAKAAAREDRRLGRRQPWAVGGAAVPYPVSGNPPRSRIRLSYVPTFIKPTILKFL